MYKTIIVHVDGSAREDSRVRAAARLANTFEAHLIGSAATGLSWAGYVMLANPVYPALIDETFDAVRDTVRAQLAAFEQRARALGVASLETRLVEEDAAFSLLLQARCADLIVLGQHTVVDPKLPAQPHGLPEQVILDGARPVLVVPDAWADRALDGTAVVGWNGSAAAARAIASALPLLQRARTVRLVLVNPPELHQLGEVNPGEDMALFLARHGVAADVVVEHADDGAGEALLVRAAAEDASLIVAGAYGHSRYREWVLGGATRDLLRRATVPVLFSH